MRTGAIRKVLGSIVLSALAGLYLPSQAHAAYIAVITQVGPDVVVTGAGAINLAGLTYRPPQSGPIDQASAYMSAHGGLLEIGPLSLTDVRKYSGISGPTAFGTGHTFYPTTGSGDLVDIVGSFAIPILDVPLNYVSGGPLNATDTYANRTLASMGLTLGTYVWTWGSGPTADSYTLTISASSVPEPASAGLIAVAGVGLLARRRKRI